jgi:Fur family ferric uptake transcriptional regulator
MIEPTEQLKTVLREHGQSLTAARRAVFAALQDKEPQTMRDIVVACAGRADRASVYRTIGLFERLGIVQRLQIGWKYKLELGDAFHRHHHHLTCTGCGAVIPFDEDPALERSLRAAAVSKQFAMRGHQLEIRGICQTCLKT